MKKILFTFLIISVIKISYSQTMPQFSQRSLEMHVINPAVIGSQIDHIIQIHHRNQWIGFEGSPNTQVLSYTGSVKSNMGLGGYVFQDVTGPTKNVGANIGYAYHFILDNVNVSIGLSGLLSQYRFSTQDIKFQQLGDVLDDGVIKSVLVPDATAGIYIYNKKFYVGLSSAYLIESRLKNYDNSYIPTSQKYFAMAGYDFELNDDVNLIPNTIITKSSGTDLQAEIGMRAEFSNSLIGGISYRTNDAVILQLGVKLKNRFLIAYSYDVIYSKLKNYNSGSHEIVFLYVIKSRKVSKKMFYRSRSLFK